MAFHMKADIVVVGSFVQDLVFAVQAFPKPGETILAEFLTGPGGKGSNQAIAACRTGVSTAFVGAVGKDAFADAVTVFYQTEGLQAYLAKYPDSFTGAAGIQVNAEGQNSITVAMGANALLQPGDIPDGLIEQSRIVTGQFESNFAATLSAFQRARHAGVLTVLNPAPMRADFPREILAFTDVLIPNETELVALAHLMPELGLADFSEEKLQNLSDQELHDALRRFHIPGVVVTLGNRGSFLSTKQGYQRIAAISGIQTVDTTGAGDAFVGSFSSGLVQFDMDYQRAVHYGNLVAGLSVTRTGAALAMPHKQEIDARWD
jgi:ribokinase